MPWRGPEEPGEVPTLGIIAIQWIEENVPIPDGDFAGDPFICGPDQADFLLNYYRLRPDGLELMVSDVRQRPSRAFYWRRGGIMVAPQKSGKGPHSAAVTLFEAYGPARFDGWDANGEPVGRPWATPKIAVTAQSEDQAQNIWGSLLPMIELGGLKADIPDTGLTRVYLPNGGEIRPVTASSRSRQGALITFAAQDEVQGWSKANGGHKLANVQYRSLAGMGGRFLQTGNAWDPNEESVAQQTWEKGLHVYKMMTDAGPGNIRVKKDRTDMLRRVYSGWRLAVPPGGTAQPDRPERPLPAWVDLEDRSATIDDFLARGESAEAERYFLNRVVPGEDRAFDGRLWRTLADPHDVPTKTVITIGVDGARSGDALAIVATEVLTGYQWPLGIWEQPENSGADYEHPVDEVDGVISEAFDRYDVWRMYVDPGSQTGNISPLYEKWSGRYGEKKVMPFLMTRPRATAYMIRNYVSAILAGDVTNDGDETMARHIENARRGQVNVYDDDRKKMWVLYKESPKSPLKIDAAAAGALSWEARGDAIEAGAGKPKKSAYAGRVCRCKNGPQPSHIRSAQYDCPPPEGSPTD